MNKCVHPNMHMCKILLCNFSLKF